MKKQIYIFSLILIVVAIFNVSSVKAKDRNPNTDNNNTWPESNSSNESNYSKTGESNGALKTDGCFANTSPSTNLPINNGILFLTIAGIVIGITTLKKYKSVKPTFVTR